MFISKFNLNRNLYFFYMKHYGYLTHIPAPSLKNRKNTDSEKISYIFSEKKFFLYLGEQNILFKLKKLLFFFPKKSLSYFREWNFLASTRKHKKFLISFSKKNVFHTFWDDWCSSRKIIFIKYSEMTTDNAQKIVFLITRGEC